MLSNVKTYLTIISLVVAVLTSGYGLFMKVRADVLEEEKNNAYDELEVKTQETIKYKNELGQEVTRVIEYKKTLAQLKKSNDSIERRLYKTISASKLKEKQLKKAIDLQLFSINKNVYDSVVPVSYKSSSSPMLIEPKKMNEVRYFDDGFLKAISYPDSLSYTYSENIQVISAKRLINRKFFLWRWIGWKKMVDRDLLEIVSDNPNSTINGRMIKLKD